MKVALIHEFFNQFGGGERVFSALKEIFPKADIYSLLIDENRVLTEFGELSIHTSFLQKLPGFLRKRHKLLLPFYPYAAEQFNLSSYDLVISDSNSFAKGVLTKPETIHICYCHTPTGYLWHYYREYLEEQRLSNISKTIVSKLLHKLRIWDAQAAHRVDYFIANSKNVQKRIKKYYNRDSVVIYPPVDLDKLKPETKNTKSQPKDGNFFLIVSRLSPYKKINLAIEAFNKLPRERLKIVGEGSELENLKRLARPNIEFIGYVPDERLKEYYENCRALIFPGEEDFGITPVEAMAFGKPVIAYKKGGVLESVIDGKTGVFFEKPTSSNLLDALNVFKEKEKQFEASIIKKQAEKFDKAVFQKKIRQFISEVTRELKE
jgi:glycosyltransferase involved in cell wall biosynthesis